MVLVRSSDSEAAVLGSGFLQVFGTTEDRRSHAEIMFGKNESVLSGRADHDIESYTIKSRSLTRMSVKELLNWRDYYKDEVARTGGSTGDVSVAKSNTMRVRWI